MKFKGMMYILLSMSIMMVACGGEKGAQQQEIKPVGPRAEPLNQEQEANPDSVLASSTSKYVQVLGTPQDLFQQLAQGLMQIHVHPDGIGEISGSLGGSTGVFFRAHIEINEQVAASGCNMIKSGSSKFRLEVFDSFVGEIDESGQTLPPYIIPQYHFTQIEGCVTQNYAAFNIKSQFTTIYISGQFFQDPQFYNNELSFAGEFKYQNHMSYDETVEPAMGTLGGFVVRACDIFVNHPVCTN